MLHNSKLYLVAAFLLSFSVSAIGQTISPSGVAPPVGQMPGTATNDNAAAGNVGEYISSSAPGTTVSLTTNTFANSGAAIVLTAGDWDVGANATFFPAATTSISQWACSITATTGTVDNTNGRVDMINTAPVVTGSTTQNCVVGPTRISVATSTSIWLVVRSIFTASTQTAGGFLWARRAR